MFKAKLIDNESYYKLKRKFLWLLLIPPIPAIIFSNNDIIPIWQMVLLVGLYILPFIWAGRNAKRLNSMIGNKIIEADEQEIRIKSKKGELVEAIQLAEVEKLILKEEYSLPENSLKGVRKELNGELKENYFILEQDSQKKKFKFELDSHYMIKQLNDLIELWLIKGIGIEREGRNG